MRYWLLRQTLAEIVTIIWQQRKCQRKNVQFPFDGKHFLPFCGNFFRCCSERFSKNNHAEILYGFTDGMFRCLQSILAFLVIQPDITGSKKSSNEAHQDKIQNLCVMLSTLVLIIILSRRNSTN